MNFNIMTSDASIFADKMHDSEYGYEPGKRVVIQQPNKEGLSLMKTIAKHIASMEFFKEPFIALQSLYVDQWERSIGKGDGPGDKEGKGKSNIVSLTVHLLRSRHRKLSIRFLQKQQKT